MVRTDLMQKPDVLWPKSCEHDMAKLNNRDADSAENRLFLLWHAGELRKPASPTADSAPESECTAGKRSQTPSGRSGENELRKSETAATIRSTSIFAVFTNASWPDCCVFGRELRTFCRRPANMLKRRNLALGPAPTCNSRFTLTYWDSS